MRPKALIIAEKKSVATVYLAAIKQAQGQLPYDYDVLQFQGNVVELKQPGQINPAWQKWDKQQLPMLPQTFAYTPIKGQRGDTAAQRRYKAQGHRYFLQAKKLLSSGHYQAVVNGCDPDREGQSIFDKFMLLMPASVQALPQLRLWVGDMQVATTIKYLKQPLNNKDPEYVNFGREARARGIMDWLWGLNASRAFSLQFGNGKPLPVGRGMTAILALAVNRQQQIDNFVAQPYFDVAVKLQTTPPVTVQLARPQSPKYPVMHLATRAKAEQVKAYVANQQAEVVHTTAADAKVKTTPSPRYFNTSDLIAFLSGGAQHFSGKSITQALQKLYERKILTYPRTSGRVMTPQRAANLEQIVAVAQSLAGVPDVKVTPELLAQLRRNRRFVRPLKQKTGHDCLMLTGKKCAHLKLTAVEQAIVRAIAVRLLLSLLPAERYQDLLLVVKIKELFFKATGKKVLDPGWTAALKHPRAAKPPLPPVTVGQQLAVTDCTIAAKETQPPQPFTQASMIKTMENIGRLYTDPKLKAAIKDHGIGTDATRQGLIDKNQQLNYWTIAKNGTITPTALGKQVIQALGANPLARPELTAQWEEQLAQIAAGTLSLPEFCERAKQATVTLTNQILQQQATPLAAAPQYGRRRTTGSYRKTSTASKPATRIKVGCPLDGGQIMVAARQYRCANAKCPFAVPRKIGKTTITQTDVAKLIKLGRTPGKEFISKKTKRPFVAALRYDRTQQKTVFEFGVSLEIRP